MAQNIIGTIPNFFQGVDEWNTYAEILDQFFVVNNVDDDKKSAFLISCIGADTYKTLRDLCHPALPKDRPFNELAEHLRKQFSPQVAIFRERTNFYNAQQLEGETVTNWYGRLKRLSVDCKFSDNLEAVLLDKFITGLRPGQILDRLCEENESLKLQQAVDIAVNKESALKDLCGTSYTMPYRPQYNNYQRYGGERGRGKGRYNDNRNQNWRSNQQRAENNVETEIQE